MTPSTLDIVEGGYGSINDETAFFEWLAKISCVASFKGLNEHGVSLVRVTLNTPTPSNADLQDFVALHRRYERDMTSLAQFLTPANQSWFADPNKYWFEAVFGSKADKVEAC
ncbi:hypothetical protein ASE00_17155 [Sphingomonas sp. Root710]|uniref:hypothetical protein n=1 Tax=Sphingomonas sp. Root710 TaxID=1736594 RepID=UPI0006FEABBD|nr:hypothetical protein [Sphingomonas sp. Root710]KRB80757.1 hypothetical protein ASE00_17155 [Sphingomonas sp. Root710]